MARLLDEAWIEGLPDNIVENLEEMNRYVVGRICERIQKIGDIGAADAHRLKNAVEYAGGDLKAIEEEIAGIMGRNADEIDALFEQVAQENVDFANFFFAARGMDPLRHYAQIAALQSLVDAAKAQAMNGTANIANTYMIGFKSGKTVIPLRDYYIKAIDRAIFFAQSGVVDYHTAIRSTVQEMARSGLRRVTFDSGYSRRLDSQARMNILEGVRRLNGEIMAETGRRFGADGVEISAHALCAPDHLDIQGRQYRQADWDRINSGLKRPIGTLNCHHYATPIIYGASKPVYSREELAEINRKSNELVDWNGKQMSRYEASQEQRRLETKIRYAKDEREALKAAGDELGAREAGKKAAKYQKEYKAFCDKTGLTPRYERTRGMMGAASVKAAAGKGAAGLPVQSKQKSPALMESDLGDLTRRAAKSAAKLRKVTSFGGLPKGLRKSFHDGMARTTPEMRAVLRKAYKDADYIVGSGKRSYFSPGFGLNTILVGKNADASTLAHELFHRLDHQHQISPMLTQALAKDFSALKAMSKGNVQQYLRTSYPDAFVLNSVTGQVKFKEEYRGVADILNGMSKGEIRLGFGHKKRYWEYSGALEAEAWAQFGRVQFSNQPDVLKMFQELFPTLSDCATIALKGLM